MSAQLTVSIRGEGPDAALQRAILATVPNDFRLVPDDADVLLVSGRDGNAAAQLATLGPATHAIMVTSPAALDVDARAALAQAEAAGTPVVLGFAYVPWFESEGLALDTEASEEIAILDLTAHVADAATRRDALLEQVHVGRLMMGAIASATTLLDSAAVTVVEVEGGAQPLKWRMTASQGLADTLSVARVARGKRISVEIVADAHARPARITHHDTAGSRIEGPLYQNGYRLCWKALHAGLGGGVLPGGVLAGLEADLALLPA